MELKLSSLRQKVVCLSIETTEIKNGFASKDLTQTTLAQMIEEQFGGQYEKSKDFAPQLKVSENKIEIIVVVQEKPTRENSLLDQMSFGAPRSKNSY